MEATMIEIKNLYKTYNYGKPNAFEALKDVSLTINDGEMVAIIGKSGAGKSTLMHILGCIDDFEKGQYIFNGKDISKVNEKKSAAIRNSEIGIVLQEFALMEQYTVVENVIMPLFFTPKSGRRSEKEKRALEILKRLEMDEYAHKKVNKLSGGQKQRVAIARAMINNPSVLLADEPTGALDVKTTDEIMKVFRNLNKNGTTVIIITHDMEVAGMCDRIIEISDGKII
ncbi:putative bacteriocin export ABC transporter, lactococcin 972 group [Eshraghiella crossota DSM 2876]|jgi:putative ABC transport system ATP-binding protein|uniref:Putative bacteriocin export ABC transporter, lactococcin 972 group n=2 Tax=Eshraghiella TaxID=3342669 RepID=D4RY60_9FIRM|nr:putative bacteriocin export ABC transporter, lactococcin 972 group [Butyrivibrio crossotus DSM 2876]